MADDDLHESGTSSDRESDHASPAPSSSDSGRKDSKAKSGLKRAGKSAWDAGQETLARVASEAEARSNEPSPNSQGRYMQVDSYKRGGKVKRTGRALLHRGEVVKGRKRRRGRKSSGRE